MGHERVGFLPKTRRWNELVDQMGSLYSSNTPISSVANRTLRNVQSRYSVLSTDKAVKNAFKFLVTFAYACRFPHPQSQLTAHGISLPDKPTLLSAVKTLRAWIDAPEASTEYGQLAIAAASDALGQWHKENKTKQLPLLEPSADFFESWRGLAQGSGFCELARLYFGNLTERYLNYFLERAVSIALPSLQQREQFQRDIQKHVNDVSKHAFETAQITQSFAAGWFNKNVREGLPADSSIEGFLSVAFGKLRDELRREEQSE